MARILVVPERLHELSHQMNQTASNLRNLDGHLGRALGSMDWQVRQQANVEGQVKAARGQARVLAEQAETMARFLSERATAFQQADAEGAQDLGAVTEPYIRSIPVPPSVPTPVPTPAPSGQPSFPSWEEVIHRLDDLLKPIDWTTSTVKGKRQFFESLEELGRWLNTVTGQRGHIKLMTELGGVLIGATKTVSVTSNLLTLRDFNHYLAGELTNQQIADTAIKALVPIPILNDKIAAWMIANLPDPNGKWHGLVTPVE